MFDVLEEKWIPVLDKEKNKSVISLKELVLQAHEFSELAESDSILECAMYRFLFTFASDMVFNYHSSDEDLEETIIDLYERGLFSEDMLSTYVEMCKAEGTSFDLFDTDNPFMQNGDYQYTKDDIISVAKLNPRVAAGTNKLFQCHTMEADTEISCVDALKLLLAQSPFNTPGGSGWGANQFGAYPPLFSYIMGESLFETLIFNITTNQGCDRADHKPFWRMRLVGVQKNSDAPSFSIYAGMHYPWRFTKLIPTKDDTVRQMYYTPGYKIEKTRPDILRDPYATYIEDKKGEHFLLCPKDSDIAWKNISGIFNLSSAPTVVKNYKYLMESIGLERINVMAYVTVVKDVHGTFIGAWKNRVILPGEVLDPAGKILDSIQSAVEYADIKLKKLTKASETVLGKEDYKSKRSMVESQYNSICRSLFFNSFLPALSDNYSEAYVTWRDTVQKIALLQYDRLIIESLSDMEDIKRAFEQRKFLFDQK